MVNNQLIIFRQFGGGLLNKMIDLTLTTQQYRLVMVEPGLSRKSAQIPCPPITTDHHYRANTGDSPMIYPLG